MKTACGRGLVLNFFHGFCGGRQREGYVLSVVVCSCRGQTELPRLVKVLLRPRLRLLPPKNKSATLRDKPVSLRVKLTFIRV